MSIQRWIGVFWIHGYIWQGEAHLPDKLKYFVIFDMCFLSLYHLGK